MNWMKEFSSLHKALTHQMYSKCFYGLRR